MGLEFLEEANENVPQKKHKEHSPLTTIIFFSRLNTELCQQKG
ncbi:hypothetical protein [Chlamydiifrater volucris]|nr:hypothetical protein [Chlamydiifrater volucris]